MNMNKTKLIIFIVLAFLFQSNLQAQFFDSVPYRGAFGIYGQTRGLSSGFTGYNPDPSNNDADWTKGWASFTPNAEIYPGDTAYHGPQSNPQFYTLGRQQDKVVISSDISADYTMTNDKYYELSGLIHVLSGAKLTIQPGTCIRGSLTNLGGLIITQGAMIMAVSDRYHPVVITSSKAPGTRVRGDWAGLLILGKASTNLPSGQRRFEALPSDPLAMYGGVPANDADNSGSIRYMRVEYAGYNYLPDQEINGVTFGAVGSSSHFDYMQSSFANDDAYEWFGGTCNHKYLIAFSGTDDEFDMDEGYRGKCQYLLGLRNAGVTETSPGGACNGLEHDNNTNLGTATAVNPDITAPLPTTAPTISNMTLVGPEHPGSAKSSLSVLWQQRAGEAFRLRTNDATGVFNSITWGYPTMINMPNVSNLAPSVQTRASDDELCIRNTSIHTSSGDVKFNTNNFPPTTNPTNGAANWPSGSTQWTSLNDMKNWFINGPAVSVYNYLGATNNDSTRNTVSIADITHPDYNGVSNGSLSQLDYSVCDFTLTSTNSAYYGNSNFQHPRIAIVASPSISVTPTFIPAFNQLLGTPSNAKNIIIKTSALSANVMISAPIGFEISTNNSNWQTTPITKGNTSADSIIYIRLNNNKAGSSTGYLMITSSKSTAEFTAINILLNGTTIAPATPILNTNVSSLSFTNGINNASLQSFMVSGNYLKSNISLSSNGEFQLCLSKTGTYTSTLNITSNKGKVIPTTVWVRYNPMSAGTSTSMITIASTDADSLKIALTGNSKPMLTLSPGTVTLGGGFQLQYPVLNIVAGTPSIAYPIWVDGTMLLDTIKINCPSNYELSLDSLDWTNKIVSGTPLYLNTNKQSEIHTKIYFRYNASAAGTNAGNITAITTGSPLTYSGNSTTITGPASQLMNVSGRAVATAAKYLSLQAASYQLKYSSILGKATASQPLTIAGYNLGTDSVVATAPANWQISLDNLSFTDVIKMPNTSGTLSPTIVYVRYNPSVPMALNQFVIFSLSSATPVPNSNTATNLVELVFGVATPTAVCDQSNLPTFYTVVNKPSFINSININGYNLTDKLQVNASNGFQISLDTINFGNTVTINQTNGVANNTTVYVRYMSNSPGSVSGNYINISTLNGSTIPVLVSAITILPPTPLVSFGTSTPLTFNTNNAGPTAAQSFTVSALNLLDSLMISIGSDFELSFDQTKYTKTLMVAGDVDGNISNLTLYCRFNRNTAGLVSDSIHLISMGAMSVTLPVNGKNATGIEATNNSISWNVFPNPAKQKVNINILQNELTDYVVELINLNGEIIKSEHMNNRFAGKQKIEMDLSNIPSGLYIIRLNSNHSSLSTRLLIEE